MVLIISIQSSSELALDWHKKLTHEALINEILDKLQSL